MMDNLVGDPDIYVGYDILVGDTDIHAGYSSMVIQRYMLDINLENL